MLKVARINPDEPIKTLNPEDTKTFLILHEAYLKREERLRIRQQEIERSIFNFQPSKPTSAKKTTAKTQPKNYQSL